MHARFQYTKPPVRRRDETVKIWDLNVGKCVNTLVGHTDNVWYLQFDEDKIVSGSADKTMCFWDFRYAPRAAVPRLFLTPFLIYSPIRRSDLLLHLQIGQMLQYARGARTRPVLPPL